MSHPKLHFVPDSAARNPQAVIDERAWWERRLMALRDDINACVLIADSSGGIAAFRSCAEAIESLIAERSRR